MANLPAGSHVRTIDRVDDPCILVRQFHLSILSVSFFSQAVPRIHQFGKHNIHPEGRLQSVRRVALLDRVLDESLHRLIDLCHQLKQSPGIISHFLFLQLVPDLLVDGRRISDSRNTHIGRRGFDLGRSLRFEPPLLTCNDHVPRLHLPIADVAIYQLSSLFDGATLAFLASPIAKCKYSSS